MSEVLRDGSFEFDVVLSFAGEDRDYVEAVAHRLKEAGVSVFYDDFEQVNLWGEDLVIHFDEVYRTKARYCVIFISRHYRDKAWTTHELRSALARALEERQAYLLPARFDDTEIPGVRPTIHYIDLRNLTPEMFTNLVLQKLGRSPARESASAEIGFRTPRIARKEFNPYEEAQRLVRFLGDGLQCRCEALADRGVSCSRFERDGRTCVRVVHNGKTRYGLDVWMGGVSSDSSLAFAYSRGELRSHGGMNAWGDIIWSKVEDQPVIKIFNLSLVGRTGSEVELTYSQLLDELWAEMCKVLEEDR